MQSHQLRLKPALSIAIFLTSAVCSTAQHVSPAASAHPVDVGVNYTYLHTNILPGCNCFSLNGGGATLQVGLSPRWSAVADVTGTTRSGITQDNYTLTHTFGVRYQPSVKLGPVHPFVEVLFGGAHAFGSLSPGNNAIGGTSNAVDGSAGGGLLISLGSRWQLMPVQADYMLTNFHNDGADHQNDLRLSAGFLMHLRR
jgi:hypothetical protein